MPGPSSPAADDPAPGGRPLVTSRTWTQKPRQASDCDSGSGTLSVRHCKWYAASGHRPGPPGLRTASATSSGGWSSAAPVTLARPGSASPTLCHSSWPGPRQPSRCPGPGCKFPGNRHDGPDNRHNGQARAGPGFKFPSDPGGSTLSVRVSGAAALRPQRPKLPQLTSLAGATRRP